MQCALPNLTHRLRRCLNSLCIKLANTHPGRANVPHVHKMCASGIGWLVGVLDGCQICPDMCPSSRSCALGKALDVLEHIRERCTSTNVVHPRSGCAREAHVRQWVDHSHSNVEPCWAGDESARRRVRGATCQFLLRLFNLDQAPRLHRAPQENILPTTL